MRFLPKRLLVPFLVVFLLVTALPSTALALDGVWHDPYGLEDRYIEEITERYPQMPTEGEDVYIKITTWPIEPGQAVWVSWQKNGVSQPDITADYKYNSGNNTYWEAALGSFAKGDHITYTVHANQYGANEKTVGPFDFTVTAWEQVSSISGVTDFGNRLVFDVVPDTGSFQPTLGLSFENEETFRIQLSPTGSGTLASGSGSYTLSDHSTYYLITTPKLSIRIDKDPFQLEIYRADGTTLIARQYDSSINRTMAWLTDGVSIIDKVQDHYYSPASEQFYGFGERYDTLGKRGQNVGTYIYNQYLNQNERTYLAIPYFINTNGYGVLLNSTYYSQFNLATERSDMYNFTVDTGGGSDSMLDYYFFAGDDLKEVTSNYTAVTAKPELLPKWAFGLWMSANEWDRQSEVDDAVAKTELYDIPATVLVLEQWSDEHTFYIFNDAQYTAKPGNEAFSYNDFQFGAKWPDPKAMVENIHDHGMKVLFWQIPVWKYTDYAYEQKDNDEAYMIAQGYGVKNGDGSPYRIPEGWFGNSLLLDFTNPDAVDWWMSKRSYMMDEIGIDGFKTDGGEMVWGRDTTFFNGKKGDEMRNQYPNEYIRAYYEFAKSKDPEAFTFSRAGTTGAQQYPAFWAGDQESNFYSFRQAINAGLSAGISGIPFWSWDLAGFTGNYPTSELYKRSTSMSVFSPIMQVHSEKADPPVSEERTPWNAQARTGDPTLMDMFSHYVNIRMNLLPYIYSEALHSSETGVPMMRSMALEYPEDSNTHGLQFQYMFGENLLVAPIVEEGQTIKQLYLPEGEWIDFFHGASRPGGQTISYYAGVDDIPVFVKAGSILPMNLNENYELGGSIGRDLQQYNHLSFRVYPRGETSYDWFDDIGGGVKTISAEERYDLEQVTVELPPVDDHATLLVYTTKPDSVEVQGVGLTEHSSLSALAASSQGWFYEPQQKFAYVKVPADSANRTIVLNGVHKASYEAEFAELGSVTTNNNHTGYTGSGFVDGFASSGDYVEFDVFAEAAGSYQLDVRYSSAGGTASRGIYVNGTKASDLALPVTANWDTWNSASMSVSLNAGHNTIRVAYDSASSLGINLDSITLR